MSFIAGLKRTHFKAVWSSFDMVQLWEALGWAEPAAAVGVEKSRGSGLPGDQGMEAARGWSFRRQERGTRSSSVSFHFILTWSFQWKSYCSLLCVKSLLEILEICLHRLCMARGRVPIRVLWGSALSYILQHMVSPTADLGVAPWVFFSPDTSHVAVGEPLILSGLVSSAFSTVQNAFCVLCGVCGDNPTK